MIHSLPRRALLHVAWLVSMVLLAGAPVRSRALSPELDAEHHAAAERGGSRQPEPVRAGIDAVLRGEHTRALGLARFASPLGRDDERLLARLRPSVTIAANEWLTSRVEAQYAASGGEASHRLSVYQAFANAALPDEKGSLRVGRQELVYGSTFLLGADTFFDGASFDAVKLRTGRGERFSADLFAGRYVTANSGGIEGGLYGAYGVYATSDALAIDLYGLLDTGRDGTARGERTWSLGARLVGDLGAPVTFEVEPVLQLGRTGSEREDIRAFGMHADVTIAGELGGRRTTLLLSYAFGSGDGDPEDGEFHEFRNPNNDTPLMGDMGVIGDLSGLTWSDSRGNEVRASGLRVLTVGAGVDVVPRLNLSIDTHYSRAAKTQAGTSDSLGMETNLTATHGCNDQLTVVASVSRFFTGGFIEDVAGRGEDIDYGYVQLRLTY